MCLRVCCLKWARAACHSARGTGSTSLTVRNARGNRQEGKNYVVEDGDIIYFKCVAPHPLCTCVSELGGHGVAHEASGDWILASAADAA